MKIHRDIPASKLRKELLGDIPKDTRVCVTIETVEELSAKLEQGFKRMAADHAAFEKAEKRNRAKP